MRDHKSAGKARPVGEADPRRPGRDRLSSPGRGDARQVVREARCPRGLATVTDPELASPSGAQCRDVDVVGEWTNWQPGAGVRCAPWATPASGRGSPPGSDPVTSTSIRSALDTVGTSSTRPTRSPSRRDASRNRLGDPSLATTVGRQRTGCKRRERNALDAPISIYEVHLGSWRRDPGATTQRP